MDVATGTCLASQRVPEQEMSILAEHTGWAEQSPDDWWKYIRTGLKTLSGQYDLSDVKAVGIAYQMHGLVVVDENAELLRPAIIWCDSRSVEIGQKAFDEIGQKYCLQHALNAPGNFTASKLAWVKENTPDIFRRISKLMLPGDYIAYKMSGEISTTPGGLSEGILWDFLEDAPARFIMDYYGIQSRMIPKLYPALGKQSVTDCSLEQWCGIPQGTPIAYRAGDQPNNAFSLHVVEVGGIAATAGTSGVVYGVTDRPQPDLQSRVNTFLHVNHTAEAHRYGVLLCINGAGILNAWTKRLIGNDVDYATMNEMCLNVPMGSEGLRVLPFGNGAERMLCNRVLGARIDHVDLNRHTRAHLIRAVQEGIAFAFRYGIDIMQGVGVKSQVIRAGEANMFLSPVFCNTLATLCNTTIELYNTDGSLGAARGAALGAGLYKNEKEAFASLQKVKTYQPQADRVAQIEADYIDWTHVLNNQ